MATTFKTTLSNVMNLAWQFVKRNGFTMSKALKAAWANIKLKAALAKGITKFYLKKVDGTLREAYGTLKTELLPNHAESNRKPNPTIQVYFDTEIQEWRCFKKANLVF